MEHSEIYDDLDDLIVRYLAGETTSQEELLLFSHIRTSDEFAKHFIILKNVWEQSASQDEYSNEEISRHYEKVLDRIRKTRFHNLYSKAARSFQKVAAILLLPLTIALAILLKHSATDSPRFVPISQEITTMSGARVHSFLPDSTEIWLNGGSSLLYTQVTPESKRIVKLIGEAYFKVAHDANHPFVVQTDNLSIEAIGTEFNICSYATDSLTSVTLTDGSVLVTDILTQSVLTPGQMVIYNKNIKTSKLYLGNTDNMTTWREGRLVFRNEPLRNVYKRLGQIYGMRFEVDPQLQDVMLYATFEDASLEQIMQLIKKSTSLVYSSDNSNESISNNSIIYVKKS